MTRVVEVQPGGTISLVHRDLPALAAGEMRVAVTHAGVNFWEVLQRRGQVPVSEPTALGREGVGVVLACGSEVDQDRVGTRVAWSKVPGSYAEHVQGPASAFSPVPEGLRDETAAGVLFQGVTAQYLATDAWKLASGDIAVVTAAAGGVGLLLVQLLCDRGVTVYGTTSSRGKFAAVEAAGATDVFTHTDAADVLRSRFKEGADVVFDAIGSHVPRQLLPLLAPRGAMILYGAASGMESDLNASDLGAGSYYLSRTAGRDYARTPHEAAGRAATVLELASSGALKVRVGGMWALEDAAEALDALESRSTTGKLLLGVSST